MKFRYKTSLYTMDTVLDFGAHRGRDIGYVLQADPGWLVWAAHTIKWFHLDGEVLRLAEGQVARSLASFKFFDIHDLSD